MISNINNSTINPLKPSNQDPGHHYHTGINLHPTEMMASYFDFIIPVGSRFDFM